MASEQPVTHLTVREAAAALRCCEDTVRAAIRRGDLPAVRIGRTIRIPVTALSGTLALAA